MAEMIKSKTENRPLSSQVFDTAVSFIKTGVQKVANWFVDTLLGG